MPNALTLLYMLVFLHVKLPCGILSISSRIRKTVEVGIGYIFISVGMAPPGKVFSL